MSESQKSELASGNSNAASKNYRPRQDAVRRTLTTSVLFGKTMQVLSGVAQTQAGKQRSYKQHSLGTHLTVSAEPVEDQVLLKIKYEAMRIAGELKEELPPDFATTNVDSSALLKIGDRIVLAGDSAEGSTFLLVSVKQ